jgi:hypothetical protein
VRRLELIERNRLLLAIKLFPWSLLLLNPLFSRRVWRPGVGGVPRRRRHRAFPGLRGKWRMARRSGEGPLGRCSSWRRACCASAPAFAAYAASRPARCGA